MEPSPSRPPCAGHPGPLAVAGQTQRKKEERKEKGEHRGNQSPHFALLTVSKMEMMSNISTSFRPCAKAVTSDLTMLSFVGKMFNFYPSCNLCFTQNLPCLRIYSCPWDEMQTIWGKLMFGCDAKLHQDDEQLGYSTECSASTGNNRKNTITCYCHGQCSGTEREKTQIKPKICNKRTAI